MRPACHGVFCRFHNQALIPGEDDDIGPALIQQLVSSAAQFVALDTAQLERRHLEAAQLAHRGGCAAPAAHLCLGQLTAHRHHFLLSRFDLNLQASHAPFQTVGIGVEHGRHAGHLLKALAQPLGCGLARQRLDAADPGGHVLVAQQDECADVPGASHMRAAAEFHACHGLPLIGHVAAHTDHAHGVAVFLAKQGRRARRPRLSNGHFLPRHREVGADPAGHQPLHTCHFVHRQGCAVREVEAQMVRRNQ
ncbi:hypothetical protein DESA109040_14700 [Deinococcus saxicola]